MPKTAEERKNSVAAQANSLQKSASLRPESLLLAYVGIAPSGQGNAKVIIDQHWRSCMGWQSLIRFEESIDD